MLRHYDAIGLRRPAHIDPATGYRSYRAAQLAELNRIVAFKDLGFTLEQVRAMPDDQVGPGPAANAAAVSHQLPAGVSSRTMRSSQADQTASGSGPLTARPPSTGR